MAITAALVKELRDRTGIAMMKCKKALEEAGGDIEEAVSLLRKQGLATADKKADRETNCGGVGLAVDGGKGVIVTVTCETDFVSGNDVFKGFTAELAKAALAAGVDSVEGLADVEVGGAKASDALVEKIQQLGENMQFAAVTVVSGETLAGYLHSNGQVATIAAGKGDEDTLRNVAMHIAAASPAPASLNRDGVDADLVAKEREVIAQSDDVKSKPENIQPKIIDGKMNRFYKENVLLEQEMLVDCEKGSVADYAKQKGIEITDFARVKI